MALKKKKFPKKPKKTATLATWERYQSKIKEVNAYNNQLLKDKTKKESIIKGIDKLKK